MYSHTVFTSSPFQILSVDSRRGMKGVLALVLAFALLACRADAAASYGWTLSHSSTDPFQNSGAPAEGERSLYLWYACSEDAGMAAAEFDLNLITDAGSEILAVTTLNGFLNAGAANRLLLCVGGCPQGPLVAARVLVRDLGGTYRITKSAENSRNCTATCGSTPQLVDNRAIEFQSGDSRTGSSAKSRELCGAVRSKEWR